MLVVGLTGGIASGKSFVGQCFAQLGCQIVDADAIGHEVLMTPETIKEIQIAFGDTVIVNGEVDRRRLAAIVFPQNADAPSNELGLLESITHPAIGRRLNLRLREIEQVNPTQVVILDAPVMFKANWDRFCDRIVFVHADLEIRKQRSAERGWSEGELERRESQQLPLDLKRKRATDVIDNSGSTENTRTQVKTTWQRWAAPN
jgi:dephospho-CoA kinase